MVSVRQLAPQAVCLVDQVLACFKRLRQAVASEQKPVVLEVTKFNMHLEFYLFFGGGGGGGGGGGWEGVLFGIFWYIFMYLQHGMHLMLEFKQNQLWSKKGSLPP